MIIVLIPRSDPYRGDAQDGRVDLFKLVEAILLIWLKELVTDGDHLLQLNSSEDGNRIGTVEKYV